MPRFMLSASPMCAGLNLEHFIRSLLCHPRTGNLGAGSSPRQPGSRDHFGGKTAAFYRSFYSFATLCLHLLVNLQSAIRNPQFPLSLSQPSRLVRRGTHGADHGGPHAAFSSACRPSMVVPPGLVTMSLSAPGWRPVSKTMLRAAQRRLRRQFRRHIARQTRRHTAIAQSFNDRIEIGRTASAQACHRIEQRFLQLEKQCPPIQKAAAPARRPPRWPAGRARRPRPKRRAAPGCWA